MNGTYSTSIVAPQPGSKLIDDLLRRELRVGDPRNAREVVSALRQRYATDAARLDQEAAGLPFRYDPLPTAVVTPGTSGETPGSREEQRVRRDLDSDLAALIESRDSREWAPEFRGWRDVLAREFAEGAAVARFASDPAMRDRGFLSVRKLGEYARVSRVVGALNLVLNEDFRRLATTLDDAANVIRVLMGEALFAAGLADGGQMIQVSVVDMRQRRETVILALRRLGGIGATDVDGDWGDDLAAYGDLLDEIEARSAPELNVYLREELLAPILDGLVGSVSRQDPETLRQLAATAPVELARIRRLLDIMATQLRTSPGDVSPGLTAFAESLRLFVDAFDQERSGARLIDLSVPLPMAAQQLSEGDAAGRGVLLELVLGRGQYSREVDCFLLGRDGTVAELKTQVKLDMVLYHLDRAVDLYTLGSAKTGPEEQRAAVYGLVAAKLAQGNPSASLSTILNKLAKTLESGGVPTDPLKKAVLNELCAEERDWKTLVSTLVPNCLDSGRFDPFEETRRLLDSVMGGLDCGHSTDFARPASPRVSLQRIANNTRPRYGTGSSGSGVPLPPALPPSASLQAPPTQKPTADITKFFNQLSSFTDADDLYNHVQKASVRDQWRKLKARPDLNDMLHDDEVRATDDLIACTDPNEIDMNQVRDVCKAVLSR